jgi:hypothetical protein
VTTALVIVNLGALVAAVWRVHQLNLLRPTADVMRPQLIPFAAAIALMLAERSGLGWAQAAGANGFVALIFALACGGVAYLVVIAVLRDKVLTRLLIEVKEDLAPLATRMPMVAALARRMR